MIQFILMLFGLAFSNNNAHTTTCDNNNLEPITIQLHGGEGLDPGDGGPVGGNTGQTPPTP